MSDERKKDDIAFNVLRSPRDRKRDADIRKAELLARGMTPQQTEASVERLKDEAVRSFFGEAGIPPDLKQGWAIYEQRRKQRAKVGAPLPPGGCLLLGREATVAGVMAEAHMKLSVALRIDSAAIKLRLKRDDADRVNLVADVDPPNDWIMPVSVGGEAQTPQEAAKIYIKSALIQINAWFREEVGRRLDACAVVRTDLQQALEPWAGDGR
jgi:hypothetical protein